MRRLSAKHRWLAWRLRGRKGKSHAIDWLSLRIGEWCIGTRARVVIAYRKASRDVLHRGARDNSPVAVCDSARVSCASCSRCMPRAQWHASRTLHGDDERPRRVVPLRRIVKQWMQGHEQFAGDGRAMAGAHAAVQSQLCEIRMRQQRAALSCACARASSRRRCRDSLLSTSRRHVARVSAG